MAALGLSSLQLAVSAQAAPPGDLRGGSNERDTSTAPLLGTLDAAGLRSRISTLAVSKRPRAVAQLARLLDTPPVAQDAELSLAAVRALAPHAKLEPARRALEHHLRLEPRHGQDPDLRQLSRATSALALASSQTPAAVRLLVLLRDGPSDVRPLPSAWARAALSAYPPRPELERAVRRNFGATPEPEVPARAGTIATEPPSAPHDPLAASTPMPAPCQPPPADFSDAAAFRWVQHVARCEPRDDGWRASLSALERHARETPRWALRGAGVLVLRGASVPTWLHPVARKGLASQEPVERAAAAFALGVAVPSELPGLLASPDGAVSRASENQLHGLDLPDAAHHLPASLRARIPLLWPGLSTYKIVEALREGTESNAFWLAPWASRLKERPGLGPEPAAWLELYRRASPIERAHLVAGLIRVGSAQRGQAAGLLTRAYGLEGHPGVRRGICAAVSELAGEAAPLREVGRFDPDPYCRAALAGDGTALVQAGAMSAKVFVTRTNRESLWAPRLAASPLLLLSDPDGFIATGSAVGARPDAPLEEIRQSFPICSWAQPPWACERGPVQPP